MQEAYVTFASAVAVMFGADPTQAENEMRQVLDFESELANVGLQRINVQFHSLLENNRNATTTTYNSKYATAN